jgi:hypothetical protein
MRTVLLMSIPFSECAVMSGPWMTWAWRRSTQTLSATLQVSRTCKFFLAPSCIAVVFSCMHCLDCAALAQHIPLFHSLRVEIFCLEEVFLDTGTYSITPSLRSRRHSWGILLTYWSCKSSTATKETCSCWEVGGPLGFIGVRNTSVGFRPCLLIQWIHFPTFRSMLHAATKCL